MNLKRRLWVLLFAVGGLFAIAGSEVMAAVGQPVIPVGVPGAEVLAVVGRPMTPVSYAGVARRTVRRSYY
jgi:hypothetical protein